MSTTIEEPASRSQRRSGEARSFVRRTVRDVIVVIVCVLIGGGIALIDIVATPTSYRATAQILATISQVRDASGLFSGNQYVQSRVQSYVSIVNSPDVLGGISSTLHLSLTESQLANKVSATAPLNQNLVDIHVDDGNAKTAADIANEVVRRFNTYVDSIETVASASANATPVPLVRLTAIHPAQAPSSPAAPRRGLILLIGLTGGLAVGLVIVLVLERSTTFGAPRQQHAD